MIVKNIESTAVNDFYCKGGMILRVNCFYIF